MKRLKRILKHISDNDIIYSFLAPMIIIMVAWQVLLVVDFMGNINWLIKIIERTDNEWHKMVRNRRKALWFIR